ncbi:YhgE/Pip family protein [Streptococcus catagoni]|uniref:YhgE/Pip family protein n=1 Tax=Streptococcus catagoni TaxID=2654874 RepID=UPI00140889CE|nr:YhgE/Pip domain-containing protein [Streptococcus catagoni]
MLEELKALIKNPKLIITMIGVALVPALYNLSFLGSMWNPYGNVKHLPVAVVNQDKPANFQDKTLKIGDDMVDSMSKNKALDYHFTSKSKAEKGLENGKYYMIVTLPENLSENATTLMEDKPKKLRIYYQTSRGHGMVASKMSEAAMMKLKDSVSDNITNTYTKSVFRKMTSLQSGLQKASDGSQQLANGSNEAKNGSQELTGHLNSLSDATKTLASGTTALSSGISNYTGGVTKLNTGIGHLSNDMPNYLNGVNQLAVGADKLHAGLRELASKTGMSQEDSQKIHLLIAGLPQLNEGIQQLNNAVSGLSAPSVDTSGIENNLKTILIQAQTIASTQASQLAALQATTTYKSLTPAQQADLSNALSSASSPTAESAKTILENAQSMITTLGALKALSGGGTGQLSELQTKVKALASKSDQALPGASQALSTLSTGLVAVNSSLTDQVLPGSSKIANGLNVLRSKNEKISTGISSLYQGSTLLNSRSGQLINGSNKVADGANQMSTGSDKLAQGGRTLSGGLISLSDGLGSLNASLKKASNQLSLVSVKDKNAKSVAEPLTMKQKDSDKVKNNGIAMAPYMISVSLMVVALSTNVIFADSLSGRPVKNKMDWAKQKFVINGFISTMGSVVLYAAIQLLGFEANYNMKTLFFIILSGWTLMAMVTALVGWDDRYGSFLSLVMLLLQVGSAGGSYPIELSGRFFQTLHPYLPMSYIVSGLRQTISLKGDNGHEIMVLTAFLLAFMVLALCIYRPKKGLKEAV